MNELVNELLVKGKLKQLLTGQDVASVKAIGRFNEKRAEEITEYARRKLLPFLANGTKIPLENVAGFHRFLQSICGMYMTNCVIIPILQIIGIIPKQYKICKLCGECYDTEQGHDNCGFTRFLMGEVPQGLNPKFVLRFDRETADKITSHAQTVFGRKSDEGKCASIDTVANFLSWMEGGYAINWKDSFIDDPRTRRELCFEVIYYLQEVVGLIPDTYAICKDCQRLFDTDEEGVIIDKDTTVYITDSKGSDHEVKAHFPLSSYGAYCNHCRPDAPLCAYLHRAWASSDSQKLHSYAAMRIKDVRNDICPYRQKNGYCAKCRFGHADCTAENCPLGRQAKPGDLYLDVIRWVYQRDAQEMIDHYEDYVVVPAEVYNARDDKDTVKAMVEEKLEETAYYLVVSRHAGIPDRFRTFCTRNDALVQIDDEMNAVAEFGHWDSEDNRFWIKDVEGNPTGDMWEIITVVVPLKAPKDAVLRTYSFTFGTDTAYPFQGGWVDVIAPDMATAQKIFSAAYPDRVLGTLNCADYYTNNDKFWKMFWKGNFGKFCHGTISFSREK